MRTPRLFRTASFKLAALYALIFGASVVVLASVVYFNATAALDSEARTRIAVDARALHNEYREGGLKELLDTIRDRERGHLVGGLDYAVIDASGHRVYGKMPPLPLADGWVMVKGPPDGDEPPGEMEQLLVLRQPLGNGMWLAVADDIGQVDRLGDVIMKTFGWALILTVTLAIGGGAVLSMVFLARIDTITRTAEAIIEGDIHRRIPLRGAADDIDRLAATLNRMLDRITALMDTLRQVSSDIAHDLRSPLGRLRQSLDTARQGAATVEDYETAIDRAVAEADAMLETFSALLRIAQIEAGTRRAGFARVDLSEIADSLTQTFAPVAEDEGKAIETDIAPGISIDGDRELLTQMIVNLIENAIRHTGDGSKIVVAAHAGADDIELSVSDNGPGIPQQERGHVLERFYRLERSRTTPGNGLGLSLVAAIADLHGAKIMLDDNHPGLKVRVRFAARSMKTIYLASADNAATLRDTAPAKS